MFVHYSKAVIFVTVRVVLDKSVCFLLVLVVCFCSSREAVDSNQLSNHTFPSASITYSHFSNNNSFPLPGRWKSADMSESAAIATKVEGKDEGRGRVQRKLLDDVWRRS